MKKLFFVLSMAGLLALTSCGAQQDCRGRGANYKIAKQAPAQMLAVNTTSVSKIK